MLLFRMVLDFSTLNRMYWVKYGIYFPVGLRNRFVCYIKVQWCYQLQTSMVLNMLLKCFFYLPSLFVPRVKQIVTTVRPAARVICQIFKHKWKRSLWIPTWMNNSLFCECEILSSEHKLITIFSGISTYFYLSNRKFL